MKASMVGDNSPVSKRVLDHFQYVYNWNGYIQAKYEGLYPSDMPTRGQFAELKEQINYHKKIAIPDNLVKELTKKYNKLLRVQQAFWKEWKKMQ